MALKFQMTKLHNPQDKLKKLWYGVVKHEEPTITIDELAAHMAAHNSPFSKGSIKGILTDMVNCIKELALKGHKIKIDDLAIFKLKVKSKGEEDPKQWSVRKNVEDVHLSAQATGELSIASLKGASLIESDDYTSPRRNEDGTLPDDTTPTTPEDPGTGGTTGGDGEDEVE